MFTGILILTIVVAVGNLLWAILTGEGSEKKAEVDARDVSLLSAGVQDLSLGGAAYIVEKDGSECGHNLDACCGALPKNMSNTVVDLSPPNQPLADDDAAEIEEFDESAPCKVGLSRCGQKSHYH